MENNNGEISTTLIVISFIFFWPLGIILLLLKYSNKNTVQFQTYKNLNVAQSNVISTENRLNVLKNKKTSAKIGAIILFIVGALFFVATIDMIFFGDSLARSSSTRQTELGSKITGAVITALLFFFGVKKFIKSATLGNKIQKIEIYQNLILIREIYDVNELARYLNTSNNKVLDNVSYMIREGYLIGIRINKNIIEKIPDTVDPNQIFNVKCPSCGANNRFVKGKENKCGYCGTILNL